MYQLEHIPQSFYTEKEKAKEGELFKDFQRFYIRVPENKTNPKKIQ